MWKSTSSNDWEYLIVYLIVWEDLSWVLCIPIVCYLILLFSYDLFERDKRV